MKLPTIFTVPDPLLRKELTPISTFDQELSQMAETMIEVMRKADGVGLAANQIGIDARIFVYGLEAFELEGQKYRKIYAQSVIIPVIEVLESEMETMEEGCLSIPNLWGPVERPVRVRLSGQRLNGESFSREVTGYEARVIQHETDHLNGKLFLDYITDPSKLRR